MINIKSERNLQRLQTADLSFCEINGIASGFCLVLSETYSESRLITSQMEHFAKIVNG